jgi:hypothetical protein
LAQLLAGKGASLKPFRRLRNHLEHFDECLDRWIQEFDGHAFFDMNIVTGTKGFPKRAFWRPTDGNFPRFRGEDYDHSELEKVSAFLCSKQHRVTDTQRASSTATNPDAPPKPPVPVSEIPLDGDDDSG